MTKYKEYFNRMVEQNKGLFDSFKAVHDKYSLDQESNQSEFNKQGEKVQEVIREWENKLCSQSEKAGYGNYTTNLAEKFQAEIRRHFPMIDHVGIVNTFFIKKISLH